MRCNSLHGILVLWSCVRTVRALDALAGYDPASDVTEYAKVDLDIRAIEAAENDWTTAGDIYRDGKNSAGGGSLRTIQSMSSKFATNAAMQEEPMAKLAQAFWGDWDHGDKMVSAALAGQDSVKYGNYATGEIASTDDARKNVVAETIKMHIVWQYAHHELEEALEQYEAGSYGVDGAVHYLDKFWALYVGSLEDGDHSWENPEEIGEGLGYGPYQLAEQAARIMQTETSAFRARSNIILLERTEEARELMQAAGNSARLAQLAKCLRAQTMVGTIQRCAYYAYKASIEPMDELVKIRGSGWAHCSAVLPWLHAVNADEAANLRVEMDVSNAQNAVWSLGRGFVTPENLNAMGLRCADIGGLSYNGASMEICTDTDASISNPSIDSDACNDSSQSPAPHVHSNWVLALVAAILALAFPR